MKISKKTRAMLSASILTMMVAVPVYAGNAVIDSVPSETTIDVKAKYEGTTDKPTVYSVDVEWGSMEFIYQAPGSSKWIPAKHDYERVTDENSGWSSQGNTITVTNHSNAAVAANLSFQSGQGYTDITGSFDKGNISLDSAEGKKVSEAPTDTASLTLSGNLDVNVTSSSVVGQIKVSLA